MSTERPTRLPFPGYAIMFRPTMHASDRRMCKITSSSFFTSYANFCHVYTMSDITSDFRSYSMLRSLWRLERGRGEGGHVSGRHCARNGIWRGENMEFRNLAASGELAFALQNGFCRNLHYVFTSLT